MSKIVGWDKINNEQWINSSRTLKLIILFDQDSRMYYFIIKTNSNKMTRSPMYRTKVAVTKYAIQYMQQNPYFKNKTHSYVAKQFIVSIDFDGVLAQGLNVKRKYAKEWFNVDLSLSQTKKDGFNALMKRKQRFSRKKINYRDLMDPLNEKHIMEYTIPPHCLSTLQALHNIGFRFIVVTSRNDHDYPYAVKFINHHFGNLINGVYHTRNLSKRHFIHKFKARIHIDDDLHKLKELEGLPVHKIFYVQPENMHNRNSAGLNVVAYDSWKQIYYYCIHIKELQEQICLENNIENKWSNIDKIFKLEREK